MERRWKNVDPRRSALMSRVRKKGTEPEMVVRKALHAKGYRYRLHTKDLPGCPDIIFKKDKVAIFIHGCFWHGHTCPHGSRKPKSNTEYWIPKIEKNMARDHQNVIKLENLGWRTLTLWECDIKRGDFLMPILQFLGLDKLTH